MVADRDRKMIMGTYAHFIDADRIYGVCEKSTKNAGTARQYFALLRREGILDIF